MIKQQSAGIITFIKNDQEILYLILHYLSGHWDFPKGKLENGETLIQAAHRELEEETGLSAQIIPDFEKKLSYSFKERGQPITKTVTYFIGQASQETVSLSGEHIGYLWLTYNEAIKKITYKNAEEILKDANIFLKEYFFAIDPGK